MLYVRVQNAAFTQQKKGCFPIVYACFELIATVETWSFTQSVSARVDA
jgi:hypothetical protein